MSFQISFYTMWFVSSGELRHDPCHEFPSQNNFQPTWSLQNISYPENQRLESKKSPVCKGKSFSKPPWHCVPAVNFPGCNNLHRQVIDKPGALNRLGALSPSRGWWIQWMFSTRMFLKVSWWRAGFFEPFLNSKCHMSLIIERCFQVVDPHSG